MCIFQDNLDDWFKEAGDMCDVYSHALCNIAATSASNGSVGLFFQRNPMGVLPFWVHTTWDVDLATDGSSNSATKGDYLIFPPSHWEQDLELGVLNQRAWVLQERLLSTRVMHFTASQVFWECYEHRSSEVFPSQLPRWMHPTWGYDSQRLKGILSDNVAAWTHYDYYTSWVQLRMAYSQCGLSNDSDKLAAISGITKMLSTLAGGNFIAGLWDSYIIEELCWSFLRVHRMYQQKPSPYPTTWRAPTWSWASRNAYVHPSHSRDHRHCAEHRTMATMKSIDVGTSASGQLKHASIILRGKLLFSSFSSENNEDFSMTVQGTTVAMEDTDGYLNFSIYLDDPELHRPYEQDLVCLSMWSCECNSGHPDLPKECRMQALLLSPRNSGHHHYQRVGILGLEYDGYDLFMEYATNDEQDVVIF
ncbi:hypothetical protein BCR34DRAFT_562907 [Clohesyomyces aquaticus]|uniref:Heterokaryon incompatibility domain-containing protein n=1 Tax=Clohesyomyces aquaticus TaxID=1231657 RepID=A0A1Y1ZRU6_9PLEO|nr:hypothetical protein BCR34DRAFT_562907 [Clohesyomyces aquaticus]